GIGLQFCSDLKLRLSNSNSLTVVSSQDFPHRQPIYKEAVTRTECYRGVNTFSPEGRLFQVEYAIEAIKSQLNRAVVKEDYEDAARIKVAIAAAATNDTVDRVMAQLNKAIKEERYKEHHSYEITLVQGWWVGGLDFPMIARTHMHVYKQALQYHKIVPRVNSTTRSSLSADVFSKFFQLISEVQNASCHCALNEYRAALAEV
ncbi:executer 1, chloroplastic-like protein, partial [Tanacetum coccineum]